MDMDGHGLGMYMDILTSQSIHNLVFSQDYLVNGDMNVSTCIATTPTVPQVPLMYMTTGEARRMRSAHLPRQLATTTAKQTHTATYTSASVQATKTTY